eukprot:UN01254
MNCRVQKIHQENHYRSYIMQESTAKSEGMSKKRSTSKAAQKRRLQTTESAPHLFKENKRTHRSMSNNHNRKSPERSDMKKI